MAGRLGRGAVTVVPMTSNVERVYRFQVLVRAEESGMSENSKAQAEQVRSVPVDRVGSQLGTVPATLMVSVDEALRLHLEL